MITTNGEKTVPECAKCTTHKASPHIPSCIGVVTDGLHLEPINIILKKYTDKSLMSYSITVIIQRLLFTHWSIFIQGDELEGGAEKIIINPVMLYQ
jgi:hypothetical protein